MSLPDPFSPSPSLPPNAEVAIIGGGIIGVSAAWQLARRGVSVALCEKGEIGAEQSGRNWGYCRQQGRDPVEIPLAMESLRIWRGLGRDLGTDTGFRETGILYVSDDEATIAGWHEWIGHAESYQLDTRLLSPDETAALIPESAKRWRAGFWTPGDGRAEPTKAAPAIASAAQKLGAAIATRCAVRGLDIEAGRVVGVVTENGVLRTDAVLLAGGAWSRLFCKRHGLTLKALNVRASVLRTSPTADVFSGGLSGPDYSIRRRLDGGYSLAQAGATTYEVVPDGLRWFGDFWPAYLKERDKMKVRIGRSFFAELAQKTDWPFDHPSPFEAARILDPRPDMGVLAKALAALKHDFPALETVRIEESWAGMIDATPDAVPVISEVGALPGLFLATGFSGHGFGIGPGAGRLAADIVTGTAPCVDPAPFRLARL